MAFSPPAPGAMALPNPKKRPSMSSTVSASAAKRRQLHPLRQTSFPANLPATFDSASARSETGSAFSATSSRLPGGGGGRGRGRPKKDRPRQSQEPDSASQVGKPRGGKGKTAKSVVSARSGAANEAEDDEGDEDEESEEDEAEEIELPADEAAKEREADKSAAARERRLAGTLTGDAEQRYATFRGLKLEKKMVRRIINAVMSQSANEKVVAAVSFTSKLFLGSIVELARDVQKEYAEAYDETRKVERKWQKEELARLKEKKEKGELDEQQKVLVDRDIVRLERESVSYIPNPHRGALMPDHLREALRRYKGRGEGYSAGEQGSAHSLLGFPGSAGMRLSLGTGGRRLFR